jgi:protein-ribulosamine 3-kinase
VNVILEDGTPHSFFLKVAQGDMGHGLVHGECEATKALYNIAPDFVPRPVGSGTYKSNPNTHFYLSDYIDMIEEVPDVQKFCGKRCTVTASLTLRTESLAFTLTYNGNQPRDVTWCDTWEEMFTRSMRTRVRQEHDAQGPSADLERLLPPLFEKVIPRLLRPLHTGSNRIRPVLVMVMSGTAI